MSSVIDTVVRADPESCRDTAKQLRELRKSADEVDTSSLDIGKKFSGSTSSGKTASALAGACTVLSNGGHFLSADLDEAGLALTKFANSIDDVKADMETAISTAAGGGLQLTLERSIVLPTEPTPAQVDTFNQCVVKVNQARESEYDAAKALAQTMSSFADQDAPAPPEPDLVPRAPVPHPDDGDGPDSGSASTGGSGGGSGGGGGGDHGTRAVLTTGGGGGGDHLGAQIIQQPDRELQHDLADQVHETRQEIADLRTRLAGATDPVLQEQLRQQLEQSEHHLGQLDVRLDDVRQENQEIRAANEPAHHADGPRIVQAGPLPPAELTAVADGTHHLGADDRSDTERVEARHSMASRLGTL